MNEYIAKAVEVKYGFNPYNASTKDLERVEEVIAVMSQAFLIVQNGIFQPSRI